MAAKYEGVMVSSTFTDLKEHRKALIDAIERENFKAVGMEYADFPKPVDLIKASLEMVANAAAYVAVIGHKYGQTPVDPARNPERLSITELEFNEADRLEKPILLFVMGENHPVTKADIETDADKIAKLNAFRERAKEMGDSKVHRIYAAFDNLEDFTRKAIHAIAALRRTAEAEAPAECDPVPTPPELYAEPPYIGSHQFVGRRSELETLDDWASATNPHPVLLFEAIGGSGKSMLTWEWATNHATEVGQDWAGRFWYSFYERGAIMADFCRRALAYMTRDPPERFAKMKTPELSKRLLHRLRSAPWLIVLDGLERVLVAYHRIDAAELADEAANAPTDQMAHRDPCAAIRPEDDDVLRSLAAATPSKVLITSRLIPRVLLNPASQAIPGVLRVTLPGLRPADAEALFRSSGISGDSKAIQDYLRTYCDCHPLVTGALAGLVNDFLPKTGNFDAWAKDPAGGDRLNLADLDLAQKRNHILQAAIDALPNASRELVSTMALLSEEADYETLHALGVSDGIRDLERRGLLQFDRQAKRYDLHPVVRSIAAGGLSAEQRESYGQRVCDFFSRQTTRALDQAETLEDVRYALQVLRTLLKMRRYEQASSLLYFGLSDALLFNLEANAEVLSILRPFFPNGWSVPPGEVKWIGPQYLGHMAMIALQASGEDQEAVNAGGWTIRVTLAEQEWHNTVTALGTVSYALVARNRMAAAARCQETALDLATLIDDKELMFIMLACRFGHLALRGQMNEAEETWRVLDPMGRDWSRTRYRPGDAEKSYAQFRFWRGDLTEDVLLRAETLAAAGKNRTVIRALHTLRGEWNLEQGRWAAAADAFRQAITFAREVGEREPAAEARLALAGFHCGELDDPRLQADLLERAGGARRTLGELWFAIGDRERAERAALAAYKSAWAEGEPYVWRWQLNKARRLLEKLGVEPPNLPPYDAAKDEKLPWEDEVRATIETLRAETQRRVSRP